MSDRSTPEDRIVALGLALPQAPSPIATYTTVVREDSLLYVAGHGPWRDGELRYKGTVGNDVDVPTAQLSAELVTLNMLATLKAELGELSKLRRVVKLLVLVACTPEFTEHHVVANGASDLLAKVLGPDVGTHARSAFGVPSLPAGISVEIEGVFAC